MTRLRSGPLAAWTAAWLAGDAGADEVLDAITADDAPHRVDGLPDAEDDAGLVELLATWRRRAAVVRLVLPVAGDVRGVPGPGGFRTAALEAGEAVWGGGLGAVPLVQEHEVSSASPAVRWQVYEVADDAVADDEPLGEAGFTLAEAIRDAAQSLSSADVASWAVPPIGGVLSQARHAGERLNLPPGFPSRAVGLLAQAERLHAALEVVLADPSAGTVDQAGIAAREAAIRPLRTAVRRARIAGYNALSQ